MTPAAASRPPAGLKAAGRALWSRLLKEYTFEPWELILVELACRQADDLARLDAAIAEGGVVVTGSQGQARMAQAVTEARLARLAIGRLLGAVNLPADGTDVKPLTDAGRRAQAAANARWEKAPRSARGKGATDGASA